MGSREGSEDPAQMRRVVQEAVQQALAERGGRSSVPQPGRVARKPPRASALTREEIRQLVAEEIAQATEGSTGGSSAPPASSSRSSSGSHPSQPRRKTGWERFRRRHDASRGSGGSASPGASQKSPQGSPNPSAEAVAVLSEDLSANLKDLRRVIDQSQDIARKIEQVLGQSTPGSRGG